MAMVCPRCGKENLAENHYCGRCGLDFSKVETEPQTADTRPCFKHAKEMTALSCGRCGRPICHRCVVIGPAGPRCKECARNKIPVSARAVAGDAKMTVKRAMQGGPFAIYWYILIASIMFGMVRGCMSMNSDREAIPPAHERKGARNDEG